jgi:hypothetical protein
MSRRSRVGTIIAGLAITAVLFLPSSALAGGAKISSAGDGPTATKSGAVINWVTGNKVRIAKRIQPLAVCAVACSVTGTGVLKGFGGKAPFGDSGTFQPGQAFGLFITVKGQLLRLMKAHPGAFKISETLTAMALDPATGAPTGTPDTITRTFRLKR